LSGELRAPALSADGLTLYLTEASADSETIHTATRIDRGTEFSEATEVANVNAADDNGTPYLSFDGLTLYFCSIREDGVGDRDLWFATRPNTASPFSAPVLLAGVNTSAVDHLPSLTRDELTLLFVSDRSGGSGESDIWMAQREARNEDFSGLTNLTELNTSSREERPAQTTDALTIYFPSNRSGGLGGTDIWRATRSSPDSAFSTPSNLTELNSSGADLDVALSDDGRELFFSSRRGGSSEIWRAIRDCLERAAEPFAHAAGTMVYE
jgi:Tol biopolymer transport system component